MAVLHVNKNNFEEVRNSEKKVLLDFFASWCGPCRMVSPLVDRIAEEHPEYLVAKIDLDREPELAQAFKVVSIPTLVVMENGQVLQRSVGALSKEKILKLLEG